MTFKKLFGVLLCQKLIKRRIDSQRNDNDLETTPTGNCLDVCNLAIIPVSQD